jgi:hypothetical protein
MLSVSEKYIRDLNKEVLPEIEWDEFLGLERVGDVGSVRCRVSQGWDLSLLFYTRSAAGEGEPKLAPTAAVCRVGVGARVASPQSPILRSDEPECSGAVSGCPVRDGAVSMAV